MTIQSRNLFLQLFSYISLLLNGFLLFKVFQDQSILSQFYGSGRIETQFWWFFSDNKALLDWRIPMITAFVLSFTGLLGNFLLNPFFRKSSSQEMFYFRFYLLTMSLSSLRIMNFFVLMEHFGSHYHILITRVLYFIRFLGLGSLLLSGIAIFDKKFQRMSTIFITVLISSLVISVIIPINQDFFLGSLMNPLTDEITVFMFLIVLQMLIIMNFILYAYHRKSKDNLGMALGIIFILIAHEAAFYSTFAGLLLSIVLIPLGIYLFSRKIFNLYLWR